MTTLTRWSGKIKPLPHKRLYFYINYLNRWPHPANRKLIGHPFIMRPHFHNAKQIIKYYGLVANGSYNERKMYSWRLQQKIWTISIYGELESDYTMTMNYSRAKIKFKILMIKRKERIRICFEQGIHDIHSDEANTLISLMSL